MQCIAVLCGAVRCCVRCCAVLGSNSTREQTCAAERDCVRGVIVNECKCVHGDCAVSLLPAIRTAAATVVIGNWLPVVQHHHHHHHQISLLTSHRPHTSDRRGHLDILSSTLSHCYIFAFDLTASSIFSPLLLLFTYTRELSCICAESQPSSFILHLPSSLSSSRNKLRTAPTLSSLAHWSTHHHQT